MLRWVRASRPCSAGGRYRRQVYLWQNKIRCKGRVSMRGCDDSCARVQWPAQDQSQHTRQRRRCSFRVQQSQGAARRRQMCPSSPRQCRRSEWSRACCRAHLLRPPEQGRRQQRLGRPPWEWEASCLCAGAIRSGRRVRSSRWHRGRRRERSRSVWPVRPCAAARRAARRVWSAQRRGHSGWGSKP